jgi:regulator of protease activity HflC (stomatin/prohibitin superfamily)
MSEKTPRQLSTSGKIGIIAIVVIMVLMFWFTCVRSVGVGRVAVVTEFGNIVSVENSGLHFKTPWQKYNGIDISQQVVEVTYSTATSDNQSLTQTIATQLSVSSDSAKELFEKFRGDHMSSLVDPLLADAFKSATASYTIEEVVANRDDLASDMLTKAKNKLESYGINVISVEITNVELPTDYKEAVAARKVAEQEKLTAQTKLETAEIDAETNKITAESLSDANFKQMMIEKWNGELPQYLGDSNLLSFLMN